MIRVNDSNHIEVALFQASKAAFLGRKYNFSQALKIESIMFPKPLK